MIPTSLPDRERDTLDALRELYLLETVRVRVRFLLDRTHSESRPFLVRTRAAIRTRQQELVQWLNRSTGARGITWLKKRR